MPATGWSEKIAREKSRPGQPHHHPCLRAPHPTLQAGALLQKRHADHRHHQPAPTPEGELEQEAADAEQGSE